MNDSSLFPYLKELNVSSALFALIVLYEANWREYPPEYLWWHEEVSAGVKRLPVPVTGGELSVCVAVTAPHILHECFSLVQGKCKKNMVK